MSYKTFNHIYGPIVWLSLHSNFLERIFEWHENLWYSDYDEWVRFFEQRVSNSSSTNLPVSLNPTNPPVK